METVSAEGVRIAGIAACLPARREDCLARCTEILGDAEKAAGVVRATGIRSRRVLEPDVTALDLCVSAAERVLADTRTEPSEIGAVICVTFTSERQMPCNACQAQARLGLGRDAVAFDVGLACSGWPYGVYVAGLLAKSLGRKVLLLDGDAQTRRMDPNDAATLPLLSDAGTATIVEPAADAEPMVFAFLSDGAKGDALQLPFGGTIAMDGFAVFRFVTTDVLGFLGDFVNEVGTGSGGRDQKIASTGCGQKIASTGCGQKIASTGCGQKIASTGRGQKIASTGRGQKIASTAIDAFVPHQANVYMIRQLAKRLGLAEKLKVSADELGNSASASVPVTIARADARGRVLAAGFGGGLSAAAALLPIDAACILSVRDRAPCFKCDMP